jgi:hypothetical protein
LLAGFLEKFSLLTKLMSSDINVTSSSFITYFNVAIDHCDTWLGSAEGDASKTFMVDSVKRCLDKLREYYSKTNLVTMTATYLDPRCKLSYFERHRFPQAEIDDLKKR